MRERGNESAVLSVSCLFLASTKPAEEPPDELKGPPDKLGRPEVTFSLVPMAVLAVVVAVVVSVPSSFGPLVLAVGVLFLELVVVAGLLVEGVEVLVALLPAAGLLAGETDVAITLVFVSVVVVRLERENKGEQLQK